MYISYAIGLVHSYFLISFSGLILIEKLSATQRKQNYSLQKTRSVTKRFFLLIKD